MAKQATFDVKEFLTTEEVPFDKFFEARQEIHRHIDLRDELEHLLEEFKPVASKLSSENKAELRHGEVLWLLGKSEEAIPVLEQVHASKEQRFFLGLCILETGNAEKAYEHLKEAASADASDVILQSYYMEAKIKTGQLEEALSTLEQLKKKAEENPEVHYLWGLYHDAQGEYTQAQEAYERALELDNHFAKAMFRLAYHHDLRGSEKEADQLYERLQRTKPIHVHTMINLGVRYEDKGEYAKAKECYERVLEYFPTHLRARLYLSDVMASLDMYYDEEKVRREERLRRLLAVPISDLNISKRVQEILEKGGVFALGDVVKKTEQDLLGFPNFGRTALKEVVETLRMKGLSLATEEGAPGIPQEGIGEDDVQNKPVTDFEWSGRIRKILEKMKIYTIGDLAKHSETGLLENKNLGMTSLKEIKRKLESLGLSLAKE